MSWEAIGEIVYRMLITQTGLTHLWWGQVLMWAVGIFFIYLGAAKHKEPLLLVPIGFGIFIVNFPLTPFMGTTDAGFPEFFRVFFHYGVEWEVIPVVIFLGLGTLTDFEPLIANPKALAIGAGAQLGVFITFIGTLLFGFTLQEAAATGIIGGADGPTTVYLTSALAPHLLGINAVAAYSYMALVPIIQPPVIRALTNKKERLIKMDDLRPVSRQEKILFPLIAVGVIALLIPAVAPLMGMFMFGNFMRECGAVKRLVETAGGALMNIVTIFLGLSIGATMEANSFFTTAKPLVVLSLGVVDFVFCTAGGIWTAKLINLISPKNKINPIIGAAGVSAVPMSARVSQVEGLKYDPNNHLLMHAMGPNLAGVIGTAAAAGMFIGMFR
ncbi:MAG: sodium ion-translocating decarboxylase subunit beta [Deltaproteobacteria bacterium]|nr:sodium ion-translocating decarboxylase subunit beta [Deltaproteobacteria bacterium]